MPLHRGTVASGSFSTPSAPTSFSASSAANTQSVLAWVAPTENGGSAISDYIVQYSTDNSNWTTFSDGVSSSTGTTVTGLTNGTLYYFRVGAINGYGTGSYANTSATPSTIPNAPATPTVNALDAGDTITWSALTGANTGGSAITTYYYKVSTNNGAYGAEVPVAAGATLSYATGNQYSTNIFKIQVRAENANGTSGFSTASANTVAWTQDGGQVQQNPNTCPEPTCAACSPPTCAACTAPDCSGGCDGCGGTRTATAGTRGASTTGTRGASTLGTSTRTCYRWTRASVGSTASGYVYAANSTSGCGDYSTCTASTCGACSAGTCGDCSAGSCSACSDSYALIPSGPFFEVRYNYLGDGVDWYAVYGINGAPDGWTPSNNFHGNGCNSPTFAVWQLYRCNVNYANNSRTGQYEVNSGGCGILWGQ